MNQLHQPVPHIQRAPDAKWAGVVMIIRPDLSKLPKGEDPQCRVVSARLLEHDGKRAIAVDLPYAMLAHYFQSDDGDAVEVYAELAGEHLEFYERASKADFFKVSPVMSPVPAH